MLEPSAADATQFNAQLRRQTALSDCADLFRAAIAPFGFDTFACGEVDLANAERSVFYLIDWPEDWRRFYLNSGMVEADPIVRFLATRNEPFTWTDLRADPDFTVADGLTLDKAAPRWVDGLVVPVSRAGRKVGLVSLAGREHIATKQAADYLCLISVCLHSHVRTLLPTEGFAAPPVGLTPRELDALKLVARGQSDAAIAKSLSIAVSTAHEHVENAKRKLKTPSRAEAVAVAVSLGIIEV